MIRSRPPLSPEAEARLKAKRIRAEIKALKEPSPLGPRHEAHIRPVWNEQIRLLEAALAAAINERRR